MKKIVITAIIFAIMGVGFAQQNTHWVPVGGFLDNMNVVSVVLIDGVEQTSETLELGAFYNDECRGAVLPFEDEGRWWFYLTIGGVTGETFTFRLYDHATQQELNLSCSNEIPFEINGFLGWDDPYEFYFTTPVLHFTTVGNWSEVGNWQGGALPSATDEVVIESNCTIDINATVASLAISDGGSVTIQEGKILTVNGTLTNDVVSRLVIEDGAQLVNASANVKATCEKDITSYNAKSSDGWYTISSPVDGMTIVGSAFVTPDYDLYRFNETRIGGEWENYKDNSNVDFTTFQNGRGYLYANSNTDHYDFTGTLNNADVNAAVTFTDRTDGLSGFNLIGNPFPHIIYKGVGGAIDNANLASGYYTLSNEGAWHIHTYEEVIQPGQGILVKTVANTNLTIAKSNAEATAESAGAKATVSRIDIVVKGGNGEDRTFVYFGQGIGLNKMANFTDQVPSLSIRYDGSDYAIAHVGNVCESLDLMFVNRQSGDFSLSVGFEGKRFSYFHLVDLVAGVDIDLLQNPNYDFTATGTENEARFKLVFRMMTGVNEMVEEVPFAYVGDGQVVVNGTGALQIVDITGRIIYSQDECAHCIPTDGMSPGVYVLRLMNKDNVRTQKIVIK